jgi:signal transduction protein with GAF and PtsI domain
MNICAYIYAQKQELWAVQGEVNIRMPKDKGIAGAVATSGKSINIPDAYKDPRFNQKVHQSLSISSVSLARPLHGASLVLF